MVSADIQQRIYNIFKHRNVERKTRVLPLDCKLRQGMGKMKRGKGNFKNFIEKALPYVRTGVKIAKFILPFVGLGRKRSRRGMGTYIGGTHIGGKYKYVPTDKPFRTRRTRLKREGTPTQLQYDWKSSVENQLKKIKPGQKGRLRVALKRASPIYQQYKKSLLASRAATGSGKRRKSYRKKRM